MSEHDILLANNRALRSRIDRLRLRLKRETERARRQKARAEFWRLRALRKP